MGIHCQQSIIHPILLGARYMLTVWSDSKGQEIKMGAAAALKLLLASTPPSPHPVLGPQLNALPIPLAQLTHGQAVVMPGIC